MKRIAMLLAVIYVLPTSQPLWPGMIIRCDPEMSGIIGDKNNLDPIRENGKCQCHWECEYGEAVESYIENGNKKIRMSGCNSNHGPFTYTVPIGM
jgi:hypothetical protein